jgi:hypothetical protein
MSNRQWYSSTRDTIYQAIGDQGDGIKFNFYLSHGLNNPAFDPNWGFFLPKRPRGATTTLGLQNLATRPIPRKLVNGSASPAINKDRREYQRRRNRPKNRSQTSLRFQAYRTNCARVLQPRVPSARPKFLWTPSLAPKFITPNHSTA